MALPQNKRGAKPPDGLGWRDPFAERLKLSWVCPNLLCDGRMVYENKQRSGLVAAAVLRSDGRTVYVNMQQGAIPATVKWQVAPARLTPQELLSGEGQGSMDCAPYVQIASSVYRDLAPRAGWGFEFDPRPADAPGCVLIKRSAHLASKKPRVGHEWYYIDPAKGYAIVRLEAFNLPANVPAGPELPSDGQSILMKDFRQSPQGFWYPQSIQDRHLSSDPDQKTGSKAQHSVTTVHYHFDFDVPLPDSLFIIDVASKPKK